MLFSQFLISVIAFRHSVNVKRLEIDLDYELLAINVHKIHLRNP